MNLRNREMGFILVIAIFWGFFLKDGAAQDEGRSAIFQANTTSKVITEGAVGVPEAPSWKPLGVGFKVGALQQNYLSERLDPNDNKNEAKDFADLPAHVLTIYGKEPYYWTGTGNSEKVIVRIFAANPQELSTCGQMANQLIGRQDFYLYVYSDKAFFQNLTNYYWPVTVATVALKSKLEENLPSYLKCIIWPVSGGAFLNY